MTMNAERQQKKPQKADPIQSKRKRSELNFVDNRFSFISQAKIIETIQRANISDFPEDANNFERVRTVILENGGSEDIINKISVPNFRMLMQIDMDLLRCLRWDIPSILFCIEKIALLLKQWQVKKEDIFKISGIARFWQISLNYLTDECPLKQIDSGLFEPLPKESHSIWVQGGLDQEGLQAIPGRAFMQTEGWSQLLWVYDSDSVIEDNISGVIARKINIRGLEMLEVSFRKTMNLYLLQEHPRWLEEIMPILDILFQKKAYIAMSDIMRLLILYFRGGLYTDVKIQFPQPPDTLLFSDPKIQRGIISVPNANPENWALAANIGCEMINSIMEQVILRFNQIDINCLPERSDRYPKEHVFVHEFLGPMKDFDSRKIFGFLGFNVKNPRTVNSWSGASYYDQQKFERDVLKGKSIAAFM